MDNTKKDFFQELHKLRKENDVLRISHIKDIAKNKLTEESLTESEEKFRGIFESNILGTIFWDAKGDIIDANDAFLEIVGYSRKELSSGLLKWNDLTPTKYEKIDEKKLKELAERGKIDPFEKEYIHKSGRLIPIIISAATLLGSKTSGVAIIIDITNRKCAEDALNLERRRFKQILDNFPFGIYIVDNKYSIEYINPILSQEFGIPENHKCYEYFHDLKEPCSWCQSQKVFEGETVKWEWKSPKNNRNYELVDIPLHNLDRSISKLEVFQDITERKQVEIELIIAKEKAEKGEKRFRNAIENSPIPTAISENNGKLTYLNKQFVQTYGYTLQEVTSIEEWFEKAYPDSNYRSFVLNDWGKEVEQSIKNDVPTGSKEYFVTCKNGEIKTVAVSAYFEKDISIGHFQDITERKQAEQKIATILDREHFLGNLIRNASVAIGVGYPDGSLGLCNLAFQKLTGYSEDELKNIKWDSVLTPPEWLESEIQVLAKLHATKQSVIYQKEYFHKSGKRVPIELVVHPFYDLSDKVSHYYAFITDITERKQKEVELILAKEKAEESDRLKSAFLANMSHEIRTPMNGILGFSNLLKEPGLGSEEQQAYIEIIEKSGARMLNIISEIMDISKIESGQMGVHLRNTNINEKVENVYNLLKPDAEYKRINLSFKNSLPVNEAFMVTDSEKLYSILTNLAKNAIKYTDNGFIEIGYGLTCSPTQSGSLTFYVKDTGIGIPKDRQAAIFERFIQADISDIQARQGAGLGLSISRAYVEMLGGKIWVESERGKGSVFYFTLPYQTQLSKKSLYENTALYPSISITNIPNVQQLKILIAEDDETSFLFLNMIIKKYSREILTAKTGVEAVDVCHNNPDIDLILMDIKMPVMDGHEATKKIRQFNPKVIIIAQTSFSMIGDREMALKAGCDDYISKPINVEMIKDLLDKYFSKNRI